MDNEQLSPNDLPEVAFPARELSGELNGEHEGGPPISLSNPPPEVEIVEALEPVKESCRTRNRGKPVVVNLDEETFLSLPYPQSRVRRMAVAALAVAGIDKAHVTPKAARALSYSAALFMDLIGSSLAETAVRNGSKQIKYADLRNLSRYAEQFNFLDGCFDRFVNAADENNVALDENLNDIDAENDVEPDDDVTEIVAEEAVDAENLESDDAT